MTDKQTQLAMAHAYVCACLRAGLNADDKNHGGFDATQYKAWNAYDDALAQLHRLIAVNRGAARYAGNLPSNDYSS